MDKITRGRVFGKTIGGWKSQHGHKYKDDQWRASFVLFIAGNQKKQQFFPTSKRQANIRFVPQRICMRLIFPVWISKMAQPNVLKNFPLWSKWMRQTTCWQCVRIPFEIASIAVGFQYFPHLRELNLSLNQIYRIPDPKSTFFCLQVRKIVPFIDT